MAQAPGAKLRRPPFPSPAPSAPPAGENAEHWRQFFVS